MLPAKRDDPLKSVRGTRTMALLNTATAGKEIPVGDIKLACSTAPWGADGVIQAMNAVCDTGFDGIECPAGVVQRFEDRLHVFEEIMERVNLRLAGLVQPLDLLDKDKADEQVERAVNVARFAAAAGHGYLLVCHPEPPAEPLTEDAWVTVSAVLEEVGKRCQEDGVTLCYLPLARTLGVDDKDIARLFGMVHGTNVMLALDTAEATVAGADPAKLIKRHAEKLKVVRFHDASGAKRKAPGGRPMPTPLFGRGMVKFEPVAKALTDIRYGGWITLDITGEAQDPKAAVENGYRYLIRKSGLFEY